MATGLMISLETVVMAAGFALLLTWRWLVDDAERVWLVRYLQGLAGGALPPLPGATPMAVRMDERRERKAALARAAVAIIEPGEFLFLDSSSTNLALALKEPPVMGTPTLAPLLRLFSSWVAVSCRLSMTRL